VASALDWVRAHAVPGAHTNIDLGPTTDLLTTGLLDSFAFADLIMFLEERSGGTVDLEPLDPEAFSNVAGLCAAIRWNGDRESRA
jgi:acyl carrier protein